MLTMSASRPASPRIRGEPPPIMIGGPGCCTGSGQPGETRDVDVVAVDRRSARPTSARASTSTYSASLAMRTPGRSIGTPSPSYSSRTHPAPSPTSSRPSDSRSSVAISFASTTGMMEVAGEHPAPDAQRGRASRRHRDRRQRRQIDRTMAGGVGDRARTEVVIGGEQRRVAGVLGPPDGVEPLRRRRRPRTPAARSGTVAGSCTPSLILDDDSSKCARDVASVPARRGRLPFVGGIK